MQLKAALLLLAGFHAALISAVAVVWPDGYTPDPSEHAAAVARAESLAARSEPSPPTNETVSDLMKRASASGCVQAHCGASKGTTADSWNTFYEITVWHNGRLILYLMARTDDQRVWSAMRDPTGQQWGWKLHGDCGGMEYLNTIQSQYGWYGLNTIDSKHLRERNGGWCYGESKSGQPRCRDADYWEATYTDRAQCGGYADPNFCDYRGRCVNVDGVPGYHANN